MFYGSDIELLPPNTPSKSIGDFDELCEIDEGKPLRSQLNEYFGHIGRGSDRRRLPRGKLLSVH